MSGTRSLGKEKGKEVPNSGYGGREEAQASGIEDMELDYTEDNPEEGEIVEEESDKEEGQGEVWERKGAANVVCSSILQEKSTAGDQIEHGLTDTGKDSGFGPSTDLNVR
ncbi:hypothetical protein NDU88_003227 [Pleurodeles waltl]|uniref:Uncharacterized protein n=1 Tax=Pleurodeles waltl TaxID=8319 RepID=A0AAV7UZG2_PLEWA|nr:hypothetical protein NDU88_003227 [Pleurodeles waltl]